MFFTFICQQIKNLVHVLYLVPFVVEVDTVAEEPNWCKTPEKTLTEA